MKKTLAFLLFLGMVFGFQDSDLDGVDDSVDRCPNTPFFAIVDRYGCPIKELIPERKIKFYLRLGFSHSKDKNFEANNTNISLAFSLKQWYASLTSRYYTYINGIGSGLGRTSVYVSYRKSFKKIFLYPGIRVILPTASDNISSDYTDIVPSLYADYFFGNSDIFFYIERNFKGNPSLKDTWSFSAGYGYSFENLYSSFSLDFVESSLKNTYGTYANIFLIYDITEHLYLTLNFSKGMGGNAVDRSISIKVGIKF